MKSLVISCIAFAQAIGGLALGAAFDTNQLDQIKIGASNGFFVFRQLITPLNHQLMGFGSTNELATVTNGAPLPIYTMGFSQLTNYAPGSELSLLIEPPPETQTAPRVIVPIMDGTNARSSMLLREVPSPVGQGAHWTNMSWGKPNLIRDLMRAHQAVPHADLKADTTPFAVEVPVFDIWFIAYYNHENRLILQSTSRIRLGPLTVNRDERINEAAMHQLRITAQRYNGLPN